jgi:predicted DNA binding protein
METKKVVYVDKDEWYPVYSLTEKNWGDKCELTEKEIAYIKKAYKMFQKAQEMLKKAYERGV